MICLPFPLAAKGGMGEHGPLQWSGLLFFDNRPTPRKPRRNSGSAGIHPAMKGRGT
jgi:hypothetical protein